MPPTVLATAPDLHNVGSPGYGYACPISGRPGVNVHNPDADF
jgi:hypothetical protein